MKPELIYDRPEDEYHADTTTLSASGAGVLLGKWPLAESDALRFGTLFHIAVLEPDRLSEYVALDADKIGVKADGTPAQNPTMTAAWKKAVAEAEADGHKVIPTDWLTKAQAMASAVMAHRTARAILEQATDTEVSAYADHPTGARVRARFDLCGPIIGDLKSTRDADPRKFGRKAADFGYHISAANYLDIAQECGLEPRGFAFINVEKDPTPGGEHRVSVTDLSPDAINLGRQLMTEACLRWLALGKRIDLPSYGEGFTTCDVPAWAYSELPTPTITDDVWSDAS